MSGSILEVNHEELGWKSGDSKKCGAQPVCF